MERRLPHFRAANTQVLGVSIDSVHCHANWARDLGGVSFPLLADFQPKGAVANAYDVYLPDAGITDRATILIDSGGTVRHSSSVTPEGQRNIGTLASLCEELDRQAGTLTKPIPEPRALGSDAVLYVKSHCGFSRRVLVALDNLHARDLLVRNASDDPQALSELRAVSSTETAPCLVVDGRPVRESDVIVQTLADRLAPIG